MTITMLREDAQRQASIIDAYFDNEQGYQRLARYIILKHTECSGADIITSLEVEAYLNELIDGCIVEQEFLNEIDLDLVLRKVMENLKFSPLFNEVRICGSLDDLTSHIVCGIVMSDGDVPFEDFFSHLDPEDLVRYIQSYLAARDPSLAFSDKVIGILVGRMQGRITSALRERKQARESLAENISLN